jgi:hypothetical protein
MNGVSTHVSFPTHPTGMDPSSEKMHIGEQVPACAVVPEGMQIPGELGLSGPSQKWGSCPEGSEAGAGSQFPAPAAAGGNMQTGVGSGFTIIAFAEYVRLLLQTLIPGPTVPRQSALVVHGKPVVPSKPWPEAWPLASAAPS